MVLAVQEQALLDRPLHDVMHFSMLRACSCTSAYSMFVIAVLFVLAAWRRREMRLHGWRNRGFERRPYGRGALPHSTLARRNLRLGLTLGGICAFMFAAAIVAGVLAHMANGRPYSR